MNIEELFNKPNYEGLNKKEKQRLLQKEFEKEQITSYVKENLLTEKENSIDVKTYNKYTKQGVLWNPSDYRTGSLDIQLANAQSNWAKAGNALAQTLVSEITLGTFLGISNLFDAIGQAIGVSDHDYSNPVSAKLEEWQERFKNEVAPIYATPGKSWGDFGWWMQNIPSIMSSLTLLIPATMVTKAVSVAGKVVKATKFGTKAANITNKAAGRIGIGVKGIERSKYVAETLAQAEIQRTLENYQESRQVYKDMYVEVKDLLDNMTDEEYNKWLAENKNTIQEGSNSENVDFSNKDQIAKAVSRASADKTFLTDYSNSIFDIIQLFALRNVSFKGFKKPIIPNISARRLSKYENKFAGQYKTVDELKALIKKQPFKVKAGNFIKDSSYRLAIGAGLNASEGVEEAINYIAQQEGMHVGRTLVGLESENVFSQRLAQYVKAPELWESAFWGVLGGVVFQAGGSKVNQLKLASKLVKEDKKSNTPVKKTFWNAFKESSELKRAEMSITNRLRGELDFQNKLTKIKNGIDPTNDEPIKDEIDKEILIRSLYEERRKNLIFNAFDNGTIEMLEAYLQNNNVRENFAKAIGVKVEEVNEQFNDDLLAIKNYSKDYYKEVNNINNISKEIAKNDGIYFSSDILQMIIRNNMENKYKINDLLNRKSILEESILEKENNKDITESGTIIIGGSGISYQEYKEHARLSRLTAKLGELNEEKRKLLKESKNIEDKINYKVALKNIDKEIKLVKNLIYGSDPNTGVINLLYAIKNSSSTEKSDKGGYFTGESQDKKIEEAFLSVNPKGDINQDLSKIKELDERFANITIDKLVDLENLTQSIAKFFINPMLKRQTNKQLELFNEDDIDPSLLEDYIVLAELDYWIAHYKTSINNNKQKVKEEGINLTNYIDVLRNKAIKDAVATLKEMTIKYGSDVIIQLIQQSYNNEAYDFTHPNLKEEITEEDKSRIIYALDCLKLNEKINEEIYAELIQGLQQHELYTELENALTDETLERPKSKKEKEKEAKEKEEEIKNKEKEETDKTKSTFNINEIITLPKELNDEIKLDNGIIIRRIPFEETYQVVIPLTDNNKQLVANDNLYNLHTDILNDSELIITNHIVIDKSGNVIEKGQVYELNDENKTIATINEQRFNEDKLNEEKEKAKEKEKANADKSSITGVQDKSKEIITSDESKVQELNQNIYTSNEYIEKFNETTSIIDKEIIKLITDKSITTVNVEEFIVETFNKLNIENSILDNEESIESLKELMRKKLNRYINNPKYNKTWIVDALNIINAANAEQNPNNDTRKSNLEENKTVDDLTKLLFDFITNINNRLNSIDNKIDNLNTKVDVNIVHMGQLISLLKDIVYGDDPIDENGDLYKAIDVIVNNIKNNKNITVLDSENTSETIKDVIVNNKSFINIDHRFDQGIGFNEYLQEITDPNKLKNIISTVDKLDIGDKVFIKNNPNGNGVLFYVVDGNKEVIIGRLPYPIVYNNELIQINDGWKTDIEFINSTNDGFISKLEQLFSSWFDEINDNNLENARLQLHNIILQYAYNKNSKKDLIQQFANNPLIQKVIQDYTDNNADSETLLNGLAKIWKYVYYRVDYQNLVKNQPNKSDYKASIHDWFIKVYESFGLIENIKNGIIPELTISNISEGTVIKTTPITNNDGTYTIPSVPIKDGIANIDQVTLAMRDKEDATKVKFNTKGKTILKTDNNTIYYGNKSSKYQPLLIIRARNGQHGIVNVQNPTISKIENLKENKLINDILDAIVKEFNKTIFTDDSKSTITSLIHDCFVRKNSNFGLFRVEFNDKKPELEIKNIDNGIKITYNNSEQLVITKNEVTHNGAVITQEQFGKLLKDIIINNCTFNLNSNLIFSDDEYRGFVKSTSDNKIRLQIGDFVKEFDNYTKFIYELNCLRVQTKINEYGSNFTKITNNPETSQNIKVEVKYPKIETDSKIEKETNTNDTTDTKETDSETVTDENNETEKSNLKNQKSELEALFKTNKSIIGKHFIRVADIGLRNSSLLTKLLPNNIIFDEENELDIAYVKLSDIEQYKDKATVYVTKKWINMITSENKDKRSEAIRKLIHEKLHILLNLSDNKDKLENLREIFNQFKNYLDNNPNSNIEKYLYKKEKDYYTNGKINEIGLEEFFVESLTSRELANYLNELIINENTNESIFDKIFNFLLSLLDIKIKEGSLYKKEAKIIQDIINSMNNPNIKTESNNISEITNENEKITSDESITELTDNNNDVTIDENTNEINNEDIDSIIDDFADECLASRLEEEKSDYQSVSSFIESFPVKDRNNIEKQLKAGNITVKCK